MSSSRTHSLEHWFKWIIPLILASPALSSTEARLIRWFCNTAHCLLIELDYSLLAPSFYLGWITVLSVCTWGDDWLITCETSAQPSPKLFGSWTVLISTYNTTNSRSNFSNIKIWWAGGHINPDPPTFRSEDPLSIRARHRLCLSQNGPNPLLIHVLLMKFRETHRLEFECRERGGEDLLHDCFSLMGIYFDERISTVSFTDPLSRSQLIAYPMSSLPSDVHTGVWVFYLELASCIASQSSPSCRLPESGAFVSTRYFSVIHHPQFWWTRLVAVICPVQLCSVWSLVGSNLWVCISTILLASLT